MYDEALNKIQSKIALYSEEKKLKIYSIIEAIILETDNLFQFCNKMNIVVAPSFHPDYALYSIEALFSYTLLPHIISLYKK
jgi:hypothetical protein